MYFGLIITIILLVMLSLAVSQYKAKAIKNGEADISLTGKNILPLCRTFKYCSFVSFTLMIITGFIIILAPVFTGSRQWSLFAVGSERWTDLHLYAAGIFILSFVFHTYIHWNWIKSLFTAKPKPSGKQL